MPRRNLLPYSSRIRALKLEIDEFVPDGDIKAVTFRADLAGLLVVLIAATYENCVKESLGTFSSERHKSFGDYTSRSYSKLSSKIKLHDLSRYARLFDAGAHSRFTDILNIREGRYNTNSGKSVKRAYDQILSWRHDFAHGGIRNTTVEEAFETHQIAKHILYCFEEGLNGP